jgi:lipoprotein-anchoring transpeptidase ErfK/SrfK
VHIKLLNSDGSEYGVGMPIIAFFSRAITNAAPLQQATVATVNGKRIAGAWYFERSAYYPGYPIQGDFRPKKFWPAHSHVFVKIPAKGLSAGHRMAYDDSLTSSWTTGARHIGVVDDASHTLTITNDGRHYGTFPVSLGAPATPTFRGIKVIMEQLPSVCMTDTRHTYNECGIKWDSRVTRTGEYLHAAPWNCTGAPGCTGPQNNIGHADSSNGCTNLLPNDALRLYHFLRIGDVIEYPNADGHPMTMNDGYGDWNVPWSQWRSGGSVRTEA